MRRFNILGAAVAFMLVALLPISSQAADQFGAACRVFDDSGLAATCSPATGTEIVQAVSGPKSRGGR
jgi:hypothetical protein